MRGSGRGIARAAMVAAGQRRWAKPHTGRRRGGATRVEGRGESDDGEGDGVRTRAARETATQGGMAAGAAAAKHAAVDKTAAATAETAAAQRLALCVVSDRSCNNGAEGR